MPQTLEQMTPDLLALPETDRGLAIDILIESLGKPPCMWSDDDPEFHAELARRIESCDNGSAVSIPYEEVMTKLRATLTE